jgi:hypothetical protein
LLKVPTVAIVRSLVGVVALVCFDRHATVCLHLRLCRRGFQDRLTNRHSDLVLTRTLSILEGRAGTTERNPALDVNCVGVFFRLIVGAVHHLDLAVFEKREQSQFISASGPKLSTGSTE